MNEYPQNNSDLRQRLDKILQNSHETTFPLPNADFSQNLLNFMTPNLDADKDAEIAHRIRGYVEESRPAPSHLTHEEAVYEIYFLFDLLHYGYGAYQYFGGDEVFLPMRDAMIVQLKNLPNPLELETYLNEILINFLGEVIADNHFVLGGHRFVVASQIFMNDKYIIHKINDDFVIEIDGGRLHKIKETSLPDAILPTLTNDGDIAWAFGHVQYGLRTLDPLETIISLDVQLENICTGDFFIHTVDLSLIRRNANPQLVQGGEIPVLTNRLLTDPNFPATAATLRNEPFIIVDLRGNMGGNDGLAYEWIYEFSGYHPDYSMLFTQMRLGSLTIGELTGGEISQSPPEWITGDLATTQHLIPNDSLIVVLIDGFVASAGETFVGYLRQMENTFIVGVNTWGVLTTGWYREATLPTSRLNIGFGVVLNVRPDLSHFEGVGFAPDLWVDPNQASERVLRLIERLR